jgi:hypothetical protein
MNFSVLVHWCFTGGAGGKGVWGRPGLELEETGECSDVRDPNYDSDSEVTDRTDFSARANATVAVVIVV